MEDEKVIDIAAVGNNYKDFDAFFAEAEKKPNITITLYQKLYILPSEIPATAMLEMYRALKSGKTTLDKAQQMKIAFDMLGEANVTEWCEKGMTTDQLAEVMKWVSEVHGGGPAKKDPKNVSKKK